MTGLLVIAILVFLVVIHELGHFTAAKLFGVRVDEFGVGYPPRALRICKIGDTEYTLNWIPFGGFVRLYGDDGEKDHGPGALMRASKGARAVILAAGVFMNLIAGWALYTGAIALGVPRAVSEASTSAQLIVTSTVPGSPAENVGIQAGDRIVGVSDEKGYTLAELAPGAMSDFVAARGGKDVSITYIRAGATSTVLAKPAHAVIASEADRPALGVGLALVSNQPEPIGKAAILALGSVQHALVSVVGGIGQMITGALRGESVLSDVVGPVGLAGVVGDAARHGLGDLFALAAFISVNLAVVNLIPVPALDGGQLFVLAVESVRRKPVPRFFVQILNAVGIAGILFLMIVVTYHDIARLFI